MLTYHIKWDILNQRLGVFAERGTFMLHIIDQTVKVKGLKEKKDVAVLADVHLTYMDERENDYSQRLRLERAYMFPNGHHCFSEIREYIKNSDIDVVATVGDVVDYPSHKNIEVITDFFENDCKDYLFVFGNHDWNYPRHYNDIHHWFRNTAKFKHLLKDENPLLQVLDLGDVLLVGVDSASDTIFPETLKQFKKVAALGKPMILFMHVPFHTPATTAAVMEENHTGTPLVVGLPEEYHEKLGSEAWLIPDDSTKEFVSMMWDPNVPVVASLCGHLHFEFKPHDYVLRDDYMPGRTQFGVRLSAPQLTNEGNLLVLHLLPDEE